MPGFHSHHHHHHHNPHASAEGLAHILDPCYHKDTSSSSTSSATPCATANANAIWADDVGVHDPDFQPFQTPSSPSSPSFAPDSPTARTRRRLSDTPSSRMNRFAARAPVPPSPSSSSMSHSSIDEHERPRGRAWRRSCSLCRGEGSALVEDGDADEVDAADDDAATMTTGSTASSSSASASSYDGIEGPDFLPDLTNSDVAYTLTRKHMSTTEHMRHHLASLGLRVDLAMFRAKRHFMRRVSAGVD